MHRQGQRHVDGAALDGCEQLHLVRARKRRLVVSVMRRHGQTYNAMTEMTEMKKKSCTNAAHLADHQLKHQNAEGPPVHQCRVWVAAQHFR